MAHLAEAELRARRERIVTKRLVKPRLLVEYPQVEGLPNPIVQRIVNHAILNEQYRLIQQQGYVQNPLSNITGKYETKLHQSGLLSLVYDNYNYAGGAHGITFQSSQTFSLTDGTEYTLADLFKPGSDYVGRISAIIKREFKAKNIPTLTEFKAISPTQNFYLTPSALGIYFQQYEYTAYVYGFPTFEIPFTELADIINPNGPIGKLM